MKKKTGILSKIYIAILLIFLYSPIAVSSIPSTTAKLPSGKDLHSNGMYSFFVTTIL